MLGETGGARSTKPNDPDKPPFFNRVLALVFVLCLVGISSLRLAYKIELGRLPFDWFTIATIIVAVLWLLFSLRRRE